MNDTWLRQLFAAQGLARGSLLPFIVVLLSSRELGPEAIGLVLGVSAAALLVAFPAWGLLADSSFGRFRTVAFGGVLATTSGTIGLGWDDTAVLISAIIVILVGLAASAPVTDALALDWLGDASHGYGDFRRWTSAGWASAAIGVGLLYTFVGSNSVLVAVTGASLIITALSLRALGRGDRRKPAEAYRSIGHASLQPSLRPRGPAEIATNAANQAHRYAFVGFLMAVFLVAVGTSAGISFLPLRILETGGGPLLIGVAAAVPAMVEIPFFSAIGRLSTRLGLRMLFVLGSLGAAVQFAIVAVMPDPMVIAALSVLDGAAFALRYSSTVLLVGMLVAEKWRAFGQSLAWFTTGGVAPIVGNTVGGMVYGVLGGPALFALSTLVISGGALLGYALLGRGVLNQLTTRRQSVPS